MTFTGTLTDADLALIAEVRDEWMAAALSTERCDRPAAEAAVRAAYRSAGLTEPARVVWADSPMGGALLIAAGQLGGQLRDQLWGQLRDQLWDQLWAQLRDQLRGHLRGQLGEQLCCQSGANFWDHFAHHVK